MNKMKIMDGNEVSLEEIDSAYKKYILVKDHPCIMAKSLFKMENYHLRMYNEMQEDTSLLQLLNDLNKYLTDYDFSGTSFESFLAVFPNNSYDNEIDFEKALWNSLQQLHNLDNSSWDPSVSDDPDSPHFSFSLCGRAFYIVGLHPESSRVARQAPYTTMVFNLHHQFEKLREIGTYDAVKNSIRKNDELLQGSINPVLRDHGTETETRQYSGRQVEADWKCPFHTSKN